MTYTTDPREGPEVDLQDEAEGATDETEDGETEDEIEEPEEEEEEEDTEPETIEVEYGGKTYTVHPDLRDGLMFKADYTRKTQEVAERRKELEARITETEQVSEAERGAQATLSAIDAALQSFEGVDWDALERQNPSEANRLFRNFTMLQQQRGGVEGQLKDAYQKREAETQRVYAERFQQSMAELEKDVPGWSESKAVELKTFAKEAFGFSEDEFRMALHDPRQIKLVNLAFAASKAKKTPKPAAPAPKPALSIKGGSSPKRGLDDRMSTEEWMKQRQKQLSR